MSQLVMIDSQSQSAFTCAHHAKRERILLHASGQMVHLHASCLVRKAKHYR